MGTPKRPSWALQVLFRLLEEKINVDIGKAANLREKYMNNDEFQKFRDLLDQSYQWPDYYEFKFIAKIDDKDAILKKLEGFTIVETPSKKGNYISISARKLINNTQEIIDVYESMSDIKGVIKL